MLRSPAHFIPAMKVRLKIFAIFSFLLINVNPSHAAFWDVEQVYDGGFASGDCSIAIGTDNVPSISYTTIGGLFLATKIVGGWSSTYVAPVGFGGGYSSLAFNHDGQPCIAYIDCPDYTGNYLKFAYKNSGVWNFETVQNVGWLPSYVSLGINSSGKPCIAFSRAVGELFHVSFACRNSPGVWLIEDIAEIGDATKPAMAIKDDTVYLTFIDASTSELKLASKSATNQWKIETLDGSLQSPAIGQPAIALDPNGIPCVAYFLLSSDGIELRFFRKTDLSRPETAVILSSGLFYNCTLAITASGIPMIGYFDPYTGKLKNAWKSGGKWFSEEIDPTQPPGGQLSYATDSLGNINISYFDCQNYDIKFASAIAPMTIGDAKKLPDDSLVQISGVVASTAQGELSNRIYVQNTDQSCGIQLNFTSVPPVTRGMVLDIQGTMTTINGERAILEPELVEISSPITLKPIGLKNSEIGGSNFHYSEGPPAVGQKGVLGGTGLNNIGLLVRTWGRVESVGTDWFVIDDGSDVDLKCYAPCLVLPEPNSFVVVTGISSCEESGSNLLRMLRLRSQNDIATLIQP
ncbi:MAG: hypothetical protein QME62_08730 [Armatimonadota bacterium]|nr:hypothetical protein [Armatimonadota bacterium]